MSLLQVAFVDVEVDSIASTCSCYEGNEAALLRAGAKLLSKIEAVAK